MADIVFKREDSKLSSMAYRNFLLEQHYWNYYKTVRDAKHPLMRKDSDNGVPMMNTPFYSYFKEYRSPPRWETYMELYKSQYVVQKDKDKFTFNDGNPKHDYTFTKAEIDRKIMNGMMSFYKEGYIMHWLWENGFPNAYYSSEMDGNGFDICIDHANNHMYGIRVYCKTDEATYFADIKTEERLVTSSSIVSIKLEVALDERSMKFGDTYVPPVRVMRGIRNIIQQGGLWDFGVLADDYPEPEPKNKRRR